MSSPLQYLELILTAIGVVVVACAYTLFTSEPWKAAAISALIVGVLHGVVFFLVRSAQRRARIKSIDHIRRTFDELVRNKLQVVLFAAELPGEDWRPAAKLAVHEIESSLYRIETESLTGTP